MMSYTNYTNLDAGFIRPYEPGDRLVRGWHEDFPECFDLEPTKLHELAESLFVKHNRDDRPDGQLCPSMSVGDVIVIGETALSVDSFGFKRVDLRVEDLITDRTWKEVAR